MPRRRDDDAVSRRPVRRRRFLAVSQLPQRIHLRHARHGHPREVPSEVLLRSRGDRLRGVLGGVRVRDGGHPVAHDMPRGVPFVGVGGRVRSLRAGEQQLRRIGGVLRVSSGDVARRERRPRRWCVRRGHAARDRRTAPSKHWDRHQPSQQPDSLEVRRRDVPRAIHLVNSMPRGSTVDMISSTPSRGCRHDPRGRTFPTPPRLAELRHAGSTGVRCPRRSSRPSCPGRRGGSRTTPAACPMGRRATSIARIEPRMVTLPGGAARTSCHPGFRLATDEGAAVRALGWPAAGMPNCAMPAGQACPFQMDQIHDEPATARA